MKTYLGFFLVLLGLVLLVILGVNGVPDSTAMLLGVCIALSGMVMGTRLITAKA